MYCEALVRFIPFNFSVIRSVCKETNKPYDSFVIESSPEYMNESKKTVRTRIAPSPTGQLHIGHLRTSLYDYALAKKFGGQFVIRIEDTDKKREIDGAIEKILDLHEYVGLNWDEGPKVGGPHAPYIQSERLELYKKYSGQSIHCWRDKCF